jgi:hypothetical protein
MSSIRVADEAKGRHVYRNDLFRGGRDRVVPVQNMKPELQTKGTWATRTLRPYLHTCMQLEWCVVPSPVLEPKKFPRLDYI